MQGGSRMRRWCLSMLGVSTVVLGLFSSPVQAEHLRDSGAIYGGVANEQEARSYPCPDAPAGGWKRTGPVVCLTKQAATWVLEIEGDRGCTYDATGYRGSCVFDVDMGDHVRVWGGRGISYTSFIVDWGHRPAGESDVGKPAGDGAPAGSGGPSSGTTTGKPPGPARPAAPTPPPPPGSAASTGAAAPQASGSAAPGSDGGNRGGGAPSQPASGAPERVALATAADPAVAGGRSIDSSNIDTEKDTRGLAIAAGSLVLVTLLVVTNQLLVRRRHHRELIS